MTIKPINVLRERLVLMHPGLNVPLRVGVDTSGSIVLLDLSDFNVLPDSFLWIKGNENSYSLARVSGDLWMTADPPLGAFRPLSRGLGLTLSQAWTITVTLKKGTF